MKNQLLSLIFLSMLTLIACQEPASAPKTADDATMEEDTGPDYDAFNKKVAVIRSFLQAHCDENLEAQASMIADTLKWSPPMYNGNQWLGKEEYLAALKSYHEAYENIKFTEGVAMPDTMVGGMWSGSAYPEGNSTNKPDIIRGYGAWSATHTESGKDIGVKWFALASINDDGKIDLMTEYWDVHGLAAQVAAE